MEQAQKAKKVKAREAEVQEVETNPVDAAAIKARTDEILDEIDDILEVNAEQFVKAYVQKGGE